MFHQVFICESDPWSEDPLGDVKCEETDSLKPLEIKAPCKEEAFNEEINFTKTVDKDIKVVKSEVKLENNEVEEDTPMTFSSHEDSTEHKFDLRGNGYKEENKADIILDDSVNSVGLFKEESQNSEDKNYFGSCRGTIQSTVTKEEDEILPNIADCNSEVVNSSAESKPSDNPLSSSASTIQFVVVGNTNNEYITSDAVYPDRARSPSLKIDSQDTKLELPPLEKIGDSKVEKLMPVESSLDTLKSNNCLKPPSNARTREENELKGKVGKRKHSRVVATQVREGSVDSVCDGENITERSCSPAQARDDSDSDWEEEYWASKEKRKTVNKRSGKAKPDQSKSEKYPRLNSSQDVHDSNMKLQTFCKGDPNVSSKSIANQQLQVQSPILGAAMLALPNTQGPSALQLSKVFQMPRLMNITESTTLKSIIDIGVDSHFTISDKKLTSTASTPKVANVIFVQNNETNQKCNLIVADNGSEKQITGISSSQSQQQKILQL